MGFGNTCDEYLKASFCTAQQASPDQPKAQNHSSKTVLSKALRKYK
jgi:hypothetical protein